MKALLPLKQGDTPFPPTNGLGGIGLGGLAQRMRGRWQTVSRMWEDNKTPANKLNLLGQIDYLAKLSSQLEWQKNPGRAASAGYLYKFRHTDGILGSRR